MVRACKRVLRAIGTGVDDAAVGDAGITGEPGHGTVVRLMGLRSKTDDMGPFAVGLCICNGAAVGEVGDASAIIATAEAVAHMLLVGLIMAAAGDMTCCLKDIGSWHAGTGEATECRATVLMAIGDANGDAGAKVAIVPPIMEVRTGESASSVSGDGTGRRRFGELGAESEAGSLASASLLPVPLPLARSPSVTSTLTQPVPPFSAGRGTKGTAPTLNAKTFAFPFGTPGL